MVTSILASGTNDISQNKTNVTDCTLSCTGTELYTGMMQQNSCRPLPQANCFDSQLHPNLFGIKSPASQCL